MVGFELLREGYVWMHNPEVDCMLSLAELFAPEGELVGGDFVEDVFLYNIKVRVSSCSGNEGIKQNPFVFK